AAPRRSARSPRPTASRRPTTWRTWLRSTRPRPRRRTAGCSRRTASGRFRPAPRRCSSRSRPPPFPPATTAAAHGQKYDLTTGTHGTTANCPTTDQVTPALDANLIENPGAEDYTSDIWFGAPGDTPVPLPDCWISSSAEPAPAATAESYAQSSSSYPPARTSSRVFWGGSNPDGGIAGVSTNLTQTIDLTALAVAGSRSSCPA